MSPLGVDLAILLAAYLLGSLPFSYWTVRVLQGIDVRSVGSGNAGATNVLRTAGKGPAVISLILDIAKGVAAVWVAERFAASSWVVGWAAFAAVVGHLYPWILGFRGGKGVATAAGALGRLTPPSLLAAVAVFLAAVVSTRWVSLGSVLAAATFPVAYVLLGVAGVTSIEPSRTVAIAAVAALVIWKHRENLRRLRAGTENRLGERS